MIEKIEAIAEASMKYKSLPGNLRKIAINTALELILLPDSELIKKAKKVDALADNDGFAMDEVISGGMLIIVYNSLYAECLKHNSENAENIANRHLRIIISSRLVRIRLAHELDYEQQGRTRIINRDDFKAADKLCWNAVAALRS